MYPHAQSIRIVPQTDSQSDWFGSHNLTNFLPSLDMLPLSREEDVIIPSRIPIPVETKKEYKRETKREYKQDKKFVSNICLQEPYLLECQKLRPKLKKP
jgi:hypothetical protein